MKVRTLWSLGQLVVWYWKSQETRRSKEQVVYDYQQNELYEDNVKLVKVK